MFLKLMIVDCGTTSSALVDRLEAGIPTDSFARVMAAAQRNANPSAVQILMGTTPHNCAPGQYGAGQYGAGQYGAGTMAISLDNTSSTLICTTNVDSGTMDCIGTTTAVVAQQPVVCCAAEHPGGPWAHVMCRTIPSWSPCLTNLSAAAVCQVVTTLLRTAPKFAISLIDPSIPGADEVIRRFVQAGTADLSVILPDVFEEAVEWARSYRSIAKQKRVDLVELLTDFEPVCIAPSVNCVQYVSCMRAFARVLQHDLGLDEEDTKRDKKHQTGVKLANLVCALAGYAQQHGLYYGPVCDGVASAVKALRTASKQLRLQPKRTMDILERACFRKRVNPCPE